MKIPPELEQAAREYSGNINSIESINSEQDYIAGGLKGIEIQKEIDKESNRQYAEKLIFWLYSNGFMSQAAKGHSAAYFLVEFESYIERQSKTNDI